jgi:hypothetical protein
MQGYDRASTELPRDKWPHQKVEVRHGRSLSAALVSAIDSNGRTIWIADAHRDDGKRFVVRANDKQAAFLELARMISTHL